MYINMDQYMYEIYKEAEYCKYNMMCTNTFDDEIFYKNSLNEKLREISDFLEEDSKFQIKVGVLKNSKAIIKYDWKPQYILGAQKNKVQPNKHKGY